MASYLEKHSECRSITTAEVDLLHISVVQL